MGNTSPNSMDFASRMRELQKQAESKKHPQYSVDDVYQMLIKKSYESIKQSIENSAKEGKLSGYTTLSSELCIETIRLEKTSSYCYSGHKGHLDDGESPTSTYIHLSGLMEYKERDNFLRTKRYFYVESTYLGKQVINDLRALAAKDGITLTACFRDGFGHEYNEREWIERHGAAPNLWIKYSI